VSDGAGVTVSGLGELIAASQALLQGIDRDAPKTFRDFVGQVRDRVRGQVPVDTGKMQSTLFSGPTAEGAEVGYTGRAWYAGWNEFGGGNANLPYMPEGRYLYPTAKQADRDLQEVGAKLANLEIGKVKWPRAK
jgi:hypothetical protein